MKVLFPKLPLVSLFGKEFLLSKYSEYSWQYKSITIVCHVYTSKVDILIKLTHSSDAFFYDQISSNIDLQDYLDSNQHKIMLVIAKNFSSNTILAEYLREIVSEEQLNKLLILI